MDQTMEKQLKTLRLQNQALLLQLRQGQQNCSQVINSLKSAETDIGSYNSLRENTSRRQSESNGRDEVKVVQPTFETLKARDGLKTRHKHLAQGQKAEPTSYQSAKCTLNGTLSTDTVPKILHDSRPETPKSILKRRKIVDDNVKVNSKFPHTPPYKASPKAKHLNFSYADVDDLEIAKARYHRQSGCNGQEESLDGSYLEDVEERRKSDGTESPILNGVSSLEELVQERLLLDSGNDRKHAAIVDALKTRPKSILYDESTKQGKQTKNHKLKSRSFNLDQSITKEMSNLLDSRTADRPLLGYDWIAGILDNGPVLSDKPEEYFSSIKEFRRENREECVGRGLENVLDLSKPIEPEVQNPSHTCVHGFIINERLFPEAMNPDEDGKNVCPVCLSTRPEPTKEDPGFVRVSIPRSTLMSPYRIRPHRRRSFDSTDSISLSNHCMAGYECSKPSALPTASNLDLKNLSNGIKAQLNANESELDKLAQSFSRTSRTLNDLQSLSQLNSTSSSGIQRHIRQTTDDLLNTSHSLRFELQKIEKDRNLTKPAPYSTAYAAF